MGPSGGLPGRAPPPTAGARLGPRRAAGLLPHSPGSRRTARSSASVCLWCFCVPFTCAAAALSPHTPALLLSPVPSSRHPPSGQELEKPLSGARPLRHLPFRGVCPALRPPFWTSRRPGTLAGRGLTAEWGRRLICSWPQGLLVPTPPSPGISAVPELGPLSLLGEACLPPAPSLQEDCGSETWSSGAEGRSQREPRQASGRASGRGCADTRACAPTPPSVPERNSSLAQLWECGEGPAPCAGLPVGKGQSRCQCEVLQSQVGLPGNGQVAFGLGSCPPTSGTSLDRPHLGLRRLKEREVPALNSPSLCFLRNLNEPESKDRVETLR